MISRAILSLQNLRQTETSLHIGWHRTLHDIASVHKSSSVVDYCVKGESRPIVRHDTATKHTDTVRHMRVESLTKCLSSHTRLIVTKHQQVLATQYYALSDEVAGEAPGAPGDVRCHRYPPFQRVIAAPIQQCSI